MENPSSNQNIGKRVADLRKQNHWSQAQLAEMLHVTSKHVSELERGVTGISIDIQVLLCKYLHCSLDYLVKGEEFRSVDSMLPSRIIDILNSGNQKEISLLLDYLNMYEHIHNIDIG